MDNPEFILVDEIGTVVEDTRLALELPTLKYRYGYLKELNNFLNDQNKDQSINAEEDVDDPNFDRKYPLIWLAQPLTITRGIQGYFGHAKDIRLFIMMETNKEMLAEQRMEQVFKPILYPIYRELLNQFDISPTFATGGVPNIKHSITDRYWVKEIGLDDTIDCLEMSGLNLFIHRNLNCTPSNF